MKKAVLISFLSALVLVNLLAWIGESTGSVEIPMLYRLAVILGITLITAVFVGSWALMRKADKEQPSNRPDDREP